MAKSITAMLVGIALGQGAIKSVDDLAETYVPGFNGSEYGRTPIRDLLHMSSGVEFGETKDGQRDLNRLWIDMVLGSGAHEGYYQQYSAVQPADCAARCAIFLREH
jgi:CubicO group peptidase (beta-lactamase class C family)